MGLGVYEGASDSDTSSDCGGYPDGLVDEMLLDVAYATHTPKIAREAFPPEVGVSNCSATGMGGSVGTQERPIPHLSVGRGMVCDLVLIVFSTRPWPFSGVQIFVGGGTTFFTRKVFIYIYIKL